MTSIQQRLASIPPTSIFAEAVIAGANTDLESCIKMILGQVKDNCTMVEDIIGEDLLIDIIVQNKSVKI